MIALESVRKVSQELGDDGLRPLPVVSDWSAGLSVAVASSFAAGCAPTASTVLRLEMVAGIFVISKSLH